MLGLLFVLAAQSPTLDTTASVATAEIPAVAQPSPSTPSVQPVVVAVSDDVFEDGVRAFEEGNHARAAEHMWHYLKGSEQTGDHFEWAELYLARSLLAQGFTHAGVEYLYNVARERKRPELLPVALSILEEVRENSPYDEELVDRDLLAGSDFGALPAANKSFIEYQQGRLDLVEGHRVWASRHFERIQRTGDTSARVQRYALRARLALALEELKETHDQDSKAKRERRAGAIKQLEDIAAVKDGEASIVNDAHRVLAQLYFEDGRFDEAAVAYDRIAVPFLSEEEADLFLEKAWTRYYKGDSNGALGILLTLDAPSYRKYFRPERSVLKALAYKQMCHYAAAKAAAREFLRRYGASLQELRRSRDPLTDPSVRAAAIQRRKPKRMFAFLDSLQRERERVERFSDEYGLAAHLGRVYELKIAEVNRDLDRVVEDEAIAVAAELLDYEEQARLVDYEVSLEVFRRVKRGAGKAVADVQAPIPLGSREVYYRFNGEYWNDELHDYRFRIDNRCFGEELFVQ
jgi:tetratricopeptide (TPR) repeat protein